MIGDYRFEAKFGDLASAEIEFGAFAGERKWEGVLQIPDQRIRDALLNYLIVQGDTEFASVEQQRHLIATAPNDYDRRALVRIMTEEMRQDYDRTLPPPADRKRQLTSGIKVVARRHRPPSARPRRRRRTTAPRFRSTAGGSAARARRPRSSRSQDWTIGWKIRSHTCSSSTVSTR